SCPSKRWASRSSVASNVCLSASRRPRVVKRVDHVVMLATALWSQSALRFVLLGAATGSLSALVALGIVLVYRTSGVLNFSAGALGGIAAYICYDLRDGGMPAALAVVIGLLVGVGLGLLTYAVMALLRNASRLARLIATLGLFS